MSQTYIRQLVGFAVTNMNKDGSVTPVQFDFNMSFFDSISVDTLEFYAQIKGNVKSLDDFVTIPRLPNGISVEYKAQDLNIVLGAIRDNTDLERQFTYRNRIQKVGIQSLFFGAVDIAPSTVVLSNRRGDFFKAIVRDDLTDFDYVSILLGGTLL